MDHTITVEGIALDLDETVAGTNRHWVTVLSELFGNPHGWSPDRIIAQYRRIQDVPWWQTPEALAWMEEAQHSDELQRLLPIIENARHVVERLHETVPIAAYITARPECVREGTEWWLAEHEFPQAPLIMRPTELRGGNAWKARLLTMLYPAIRGIIDDNPRLIEYLPESYQGTVFLYGHAEFRHPALRVVAVPTWADVHPAILRVFG